ncbi:MAG: hypothetical protein GWO24_05450 [Akkermansiaceae bacterium]|nr:hypothetical protein [Akkermansiaceae bacterium]
MAGSAFYYLALEPILRRLWPQTLISWSRLLAGTIRDPLVGRTIMVGVLAGVATSLLRHLGATVEGQLLATTDWNRLVSSGGGISIILDQSQRALFYGFGTGIVIVLFVALLRSRRLAAAVATLVIALIVLRPTGFLLTAFTVAATSVMVVVLIRHGVLALVVAIWVFFILEHLPVTIEVDQWYAGAGILAVVAILILALYGFAISTPTRGMLGGLLMEDRHAHPSPSDTIK